MTNTAAELGTTTVTKGTPEALVVTKANRTVYIIVIVILGAVLLVGVVGWLLLAANNITLPESLGVILGAVAGGLVAIVSSK